MDLETYLDETRTAEEIGKLRASGSGCLVMASNHDFQKTPSTEEMVRRLRRMEELGADAAKLAVMPTNRQDVLNLLQATVTAAETLSVPVVTMSMGSMGVISRICGSLTGSAMTFASAGEASAPGQIPVEQMAEQAGCKAFNGMYMLLYQGAYAFELWTGKQMPVELVKEKYFR